MVSNTAVVNAWIHGRPAKARNFRTDGKNLWSYKLIIAVGTKVLQFTAKGDRGFFSMTTSRHVGMANAAVQSKRTQRFVQYRKNWERAHRKGYYRETDLYSAEHFSFT